MPKAKIRVSCFDFKESCHFWICFNIMLVSFPKVICGCTRVGCSRGGSTVTSNARTMGLGDSFGGGGAGTPEATKAVGGFFLTFGRYPKSTGCSSTRKLPFKLHFAEYNVDQGSTKRPRWRSCRRIRSSFPLPRRF